MKKKLIQSLIDKNRPITERVLYLMLLEDGLKKDYQSFKRSAKYYRRVKKLIEGIHYVRKKQQVLYYPSYYRLVKKVFKVK